MLVCGEGHANVLSRGIPQSMNNNRNKKPDWSLSIKTRTGVEPEGRGTIGAGWTSDDGSIVIKLNPCVVLRFEDMATISLRLFPADYVKRTRTVSEGPERARTASDGPDYSKSPRDEDDETPF